MSDKKGSGLDIFDSLTKKKDSAMPSDSGVVAKGTAAASKAPPPPPSLSRPRPPSSGPGAPAPPPSLAQLAAPVNRPSAGPPPPPSSLRPQTAPTPPPPPASAPTPPPPSLRQPSAPPPPPRPSQPQAPRNSAPPPPSAPPVLPSLPRPAPVPAALNSYGGDAEDDAPTRVYSGDSSGGSQPPPPMKTLPRNERPVPSPAPLTARTAPSKAVLFPAGKSSKLNVAYVVAGAAAVLAIAALYFFVAGRGGALTVTVSGPGGRPLDGVQVFVDGAKRCDTSPCAVASLSAGAHLVRASAKGYQDTADQAVSIQAGEQSTHNISLAQAGAGTGVRVSALGSGLKLYVDGQEIGELPQTAKNLAPGEHSLKVGGSDRYEPWEDKISLDDGEMKTVGPLKLKVKKGLATFKAGPGADGARVLLDGRLVPELPATIEVPAGKQLTLLATKSGYSTYRRNVNFDDGVAEKTFEITMAEGVEDAPLSSSSPEEPAPHTGGTVSAPHTGGTPQHAPPPPPPSRVAQTGKAVLNMNSIPVTNVIVNGRPLGATPKVGIQVTPGPQTVVFVHPTLGRKVMTANVGAGETKTFMAKLP